jgi:hypothetical protein
VQTLSVGLTMAAAVLGLTRGPVPGGGSLWLRPDIREHRPA